MRKAKKFMALGAGLLVTGGLAGGVATSAAQAGSDHGSHRHGWVRWGDRSDYIKDHLALDAALREHAALTTPYLEAELNQEADLQALKGAMDVNSNTIADLVVKKYPGVNRAQFLQKWQAHIGFYVDYLNATKAGDQAAKDTAKQNLATFAKDVSTMLDAANYKVDQVKLEEHLKMHGDQVMVIIDSMVAGDFTKVYTTSHEAYEHMGVVAKSLSLKFMTHF